VSELGREAKELIDRVGDRDGPSRRDRERVRHLVSASLAAASTAATSASLAAGAAGSVGATLAKSAGLSQIALWICVGGVVGAAVSAPVLLSDAPSSSIPSARAVASPKRVRAPSRKQPETTLPSAPLLEADAGTAEAVAARPAPAPKLPAAAPAESANTAAFPAPPPAATSEGGLRGETRLLEQAQRARAAGRADRALQILTSYAARFPGGVLRSESLVMQVLCLCELGRHTEAQALAEQLLKLHPESPLVQRLSRSCVQLPSG